MPVGVITMNQLNAHSTMVPHDLNNEELGIKDVWNFNLEAEFDTIRRVS